MIRYTLIQIVKSNRFIYNVYKVSVSTLLKIIRPFVQTDNKLILFVSYGGRYYNDSPKCIYEYMKKDARFSEYKLEWAFLNPKEHRIEKKIKIDSLRYYIHALQARCWVTNVNMERGLEFRGKNTYYFFTTHGTLPKLTGKDVIGKKLFGGDFKYQYDRSCAQSKIERDYQKSMYGLTEDQILICGYPKNDRLVEQNVRERTDIKTKIGIPSEKKVILYAPTFRDGIKKTIEFPLDIDIWNKMLGEQYVLLVRAHPVVTNMINLPNNRGFVYDVSDYQDNTDLMLVSDFLVSDYSGIFFEYAVLHRPMYCYAYDYDQYERDRGLYFDIRKELPSGDENYIIEHILSGGDIDMPKVEAFISKYVTEYGHATQKAVDNIYCEITK